MENNMSNAVIEFKDRKILELYQAGRLRPTADGRVEKKLKKSGRWVAVGETPCPNMYSRFHFERVRYRTHRAILVMTHGLPPSGMADAAHLNGDRTDNRPENLAWQSRATNIRDAMRHGTFWQGFGNAARTSFSDHVRIQELAAQGWTRGALARAFGVSMGTIGRLLRTTPHTEPLCASAYDMVSPDGRRFRGQNLKSACRLLGISYDAALGGRKRHRPFAGGWWHAEDLPQQVAA